jgi:DNA-directed RNA polymerase specialized sigma24 family protein
MPHAISHAHARAVMNAVAALPAPERAVVEAVDVRGVPHSEAANALGVPLGIVLRRLYDGRQRVVRALDF